MTIFLEPTETLKASDWTAFGGSGAIWALMAQGVRQPAAPAAKGGEWDVGTESGNQLSIAFAPLPEGTVVTKATIWVYVAFHGSTGARAQYGWGSFGENAQGFGVLAAGWNALTVASANLAHVGELWVEVQGGGPTQGAQAWAAYVAVNEEEEPPPAAPAAILAPPGAAVTGQPILL